MPTLNETIDLIAAIAAAASLLPAIWLLTLYRARVLSVGRAVRHPESRQPAPQPTDASIIVLSGNDSEALERLLTRIFSQDFDGQMEIIVVNDGKSENVKDVVTRMKNSRRAGNLHITFTPPGARNVSHRKLSITLGVKAARHPVAVIVDEQSFIPSNRWLASMVAPFSDPNIQIVLGSALPDPAADVHPKGSKRYRAFTHAADAVAWISAALRHAPYRGCGGNIAYRCRFFFDNKGFSSALNLRDGDDDIFINRVATSRNTTVVITPETLITYASPTSRSEYNNRRPRRFFTARRLRQSTPRFFGFSSAMAWTFTLLALSATALAATSHNWIVTTISALAVIGVWLTVALTWRYTIQALCGRRLLITIPPMILRRPLTNARHKWLAKLRSKEYYTWG